MLYEGLQWLQGSEIHIIHHWIKVPSSTLLENRLFESVWNK